MANIGIYRKEGYIDPDPDLRKYKISEIDRKVLLLTYNGNSLFTRVETCFIGFIMTAPIAAGSFIYGTHYVNEPLSFFVALGAFFASIAVIFLINCLRIFRILKRWRYATAVQNLIDNDDKEYIKRVEELNRG